jgi:hypothetical protein
MYTFRVNTLQRQTVHKTLSKEINKKQEKVKENKIVAPVKKVSDVAHVTEPAPVKKVSDVAHVTEPAHVKKMSDVDHVTEPAPVKKVSGIAHLFNK